MPKNILQDEALDYTGDDKGNPTPEERADFIVKKLEQFIRDGRTVGEGMSLRKWQEMARVEIANAIVESEVDAQEDDVVTKRLLFTIGSSLTTIGFWGALWSYGKISYLISAFVCVMAGIVLIAIALEWRVRKFWKSQKVKKREKALRRCEELTRRIKKLERELEKEEKDKRQRLEDTLAEQLVKTAKKLNLPNAG